MATKEFIFDSEQSKIISLQGGQNLVLGGPGCGKTQLLAERIIHAYRQGIPYEDMLCLTFTKRASREMSDRIKQQIPEAYDKIFIGNIHHFCYHFLYDNEIIGPNTQVMDAVEQDEIIASECKIKNYNEKQYFKQFWVRSYQLGYRHPEKSYMPLKKDVYPELQDRISMAARKYQDYKNKHQLVDFDDLLLITYTALLEPDSRQKYRMASYPWIQIDEAQDLTNLQWCIIQKLIAAPWSTAIYFADLGQKIFSFLNKGKDNLRIMMEQCKGKVHYLSNNYRSNPVLVNLCNVFALQNLANNDMPLPVPQKPDDMESIPLLVKCGNDNQELFVASQIRTWNFQFPEDSIGVLCRSNRMCEYVAKKLASHHIPHYHVGDTDLFSRPEFKLLLSHLAVAQDDTRLQDWRRILHNGHFCYFDQAWDMVQSLFSWGITPLDLMEYPGSCYLLKFWKMYRSGKFAVLHCTTSGPDLSDEILTIEAAQYVNHTKYSHRMFNLQSAEECRSLMDYLDEFDWVSHGMDKLKIMLQRQLDRMGLYCRMPECWDTERIYRRLFQNLDSYEFHFLLDDFFLNTEGFDLMNQCALVEFSMIEEEKMVEHQKIALDDYRIETLVNEMNEFYCSIYRDTRNIIFSSGTGEKYAIAAQLEQIDEAFIKNSRYHDAFIPLPLVQRMIHKVMNGDDMILPLYDQLNHYLSDISQLTEAEMLDSGVIHEKIRVMTVHKAKGQEFDHVVVFDVADGTYPASWDSSTEESMRVLYVAMSRARKRLCLTYNYKKSPFITDEVERQLYVMPEGQCDKMVMMEKTFAELGS